MARPRSYSDDELVRAVASSTSWRGVLRSLGLAATSAAQMRSVRSHVTALGLDVAHFTGQRRWTENQLAAAIADSTSWSEVVAHLGLVGGSSESTLRAHALRLGLETAHLGVRRASSPPIQSSEPNLELLPRAGALMAAAWFTLRGFDVSWPLEPARYDLLALRGDEVLRVQVKTTTHRPSGSWVVSISTGGRLRSTYGPEEIDWFFVVDGELQCYLIPVEAVGGLLALRLTAYERYRVGGLSSSPHAVEA